jgi:hypothetical protein
LNHLLACNAHLQGDWKFINTVRGLAAPHARYGCFLCKANLLQPCALGEERTLAEEYAIGLELVQQPQTATASHEGHFAVVRQPILICSLDHIVPLPLHIYLGLGNFLIKRVYGGIVGKKWIGERIALVRQGKVPNGWSEVFDLNGKQLEEWIKKGHCAAVVAELERLRQGGARQRVRFVCDGSLVHSSPLQPPPGAEDRLSTAARWLKGLHRHLLPARPWTSEEVGEFKQLQEEMWRDWQQITLRQPIPKLHMLAHAVQFAEKNRALGRFSEAPIEAAHGEYDSPFTLSHNNQADVEKGWEQRLRRSLVSVTLRAMAQVNFNQL